MVIIGISYLGRRLGWSGWAFVMSTIGMRTPLLSRHPEYKHDRHGHRLLGPLCSPLHPIIPNNSSRKLSSSLLHAWTLKCWWRPTQKRYQKGTYIAPPVLQDGVRKGCSPWTNQAERCSAGLIALLYRLALPGVLSWQ